MRAFATFMMIAGLVLLGSVAACDRQPAAGDHSPKIEVRQYGIPAAIVDYEVRGLKTGRERLYFDHWGAREARYIHTEMHVLGLPQEEHELTITDGEWQYTIDLPKGSGIRERNPLVLKYGDSIGADGVLTLGDDVMEDMGGYKAGTNKILGRTCQIWLVPEHHAQYCLWNNLPLLTIVRRRGVELVTEAVSLEENVPVRDEIFHIPETVSIRDAGEGTKK